MTLPRFQYVAPKTLEEALELMSRHNGELEIVAGGTEILGRLKHRLVNPSYVMSLKGIKGLKGIRRRASWSSAR